MESASLSPQRVIDGFDGKDPETAEGAMTLAAAYQSLGKAAEAQALIRRVWRDKVFEADVQARMVGRYGQILTADDNARRLDILLYGAQGPAAKALWRACPRRSNPIPAWRSSGRAITASATSTPWRCNICAVSPPICRRKSRRKSGRNGGR
jgi:hypothetical protein